MKRLRHKMFSWHAQDHTASKWPSQDPSLYDPRLCYSLVRLPNADSNVSVIGTFPEYFSGQGLYLPNHKYTLQWIKMYSLTICICPSVADKLILPCVSAWDGVTGPIPAAGHDLQVGGGRRGFHKCFLSEILMYRSRDNPHLNPHPGYWWRTESPWTIPIVRRSLGG